MKKRILVLALLVCVALALTAAIVFAEVELVETNTKTNGVTTVTWDSSFDDLDYTQGLTATMTVTWDVDPGVAVYDSFDLRCSDDDNENLDTKKGNRECSSFTPRSKNDPVNGELLSVSPGDNSVTVEFRFTELHSCSERNVEMGNAHFKLYLSVDTDGDGEPDKVVGYGVNVHVEDPR